MRSFVGGYEYLIAVVVLCKMVVELSRLRGLALVVTQMCGGLFGRHDQVGDPLIDDRSATIMICVKGWPRPGHHPQR